MSGKAPLEVPDIRGLLSSIIWDWPQFGNPLAMEQRSLGPSGPETQKKSEKSLPGPEAPGPPESLEKVSKKSFGSFSRLFSDSPDFFETFFRLFRGFGPGGPERPLFHGQRAPNNRVSSDITPDFLKRMRLFCLQLEASCLQWSFCTYS